VQQQQQQWLPQLMSRMATDVPACPALLGAASGLLATRAALNNRHQQ
jgi:hypothetical protein